MSIPSSITRMVTPVAAMPSRMARWTGAGPRSSGSSEKCTFTGASLGRPSTSDGRISPYATTTRTSGRARRSRSNPGPDLTVSTSCRGSPNRAAAPATGVGTVPLPRGAGRGNRVIAKATW